MKNLKIVHFLLDIFKKIIKIQAFRVLTSINFELEYFEQLKFSKFSSSSISSLDGIVWVIELFEARPNTNWRDYLAYLKLLKNDTFPTNVFQQRFFWKFVPCNFFSDKQNLSQSEALLSSRCFPNTTKRLMLYLLSSTRNLIWKIHIKKDFLFTHCSQNVPKINIRYDIHLGCGVPRRGFCKRRRRKKFR